MDVRVGLWRKLSAEELMLLNCSVGEDSWESLGLQGDPTSPSYRRSVLSVHWKDWCWSWNSNTLATWCEELTHLKRPWCWERLRAGGEVNDRGWDGWMASPTQWTWVWINSGSWWWTGRPGVLQCMWLQRVGHHWATKLKLNYIISFLSWKQSHGSSYRKEKNQHKTKHQNSGDGFPRCLSGKEFTCQCRRHRFHPWSGRIPCASEQLSSYAATIEPVLYSLEATTPEPTYLDYWSLLTYSLCSAAREATAVRSPCAMTGA